MIEHRYVDAGGLRTHVAEAGSGEPLLLVHGWPQHWYEWRDLIGLLAGERRLICPDLRGFGWTDAPPGTIDSEIFAADLVALLDALGLDRVDVVGHDWGSFAGQLLALRHPERVLRLLAMSAPHPWVRPAPPLLAEAWRAWYTIPLALGIRPRQLAAWFLRRDGVDEEAVGAFAGRLDEDATGRLYRSYLRSFADVTGGSYRGLRSTTPTLMLSGAEDPYVSPRLLEGFEPHADDMRLEIVPGVSHFIVDQRPELVAERVRTFLAP